jgi:hypothetical protein
MGKTSAIKEKDQGGISMGLRFRKSIKLGGGFRINISKSGIGYSWGMKGVRITKTTKGNVRGTIGISGTGLYYSEEISHKRKTNKQGRVNNCVPHTPVPVQPANDILTSENMETVNVGDYQTAEYRDLLYSIKKIQGLNFLSTILIWTFLLSAIPVFVFTGIVGVILKICVHVKLPIAMEYEFDEDTQHSFENLTATWMSMNQNKKFWQTISAAKIQNTKVNGGASRSVTRIPAKAIGKPPFFIKPNVKIFGLKLRKQQLFFLPDKLLVVSGTKVGAINYNEIRMELGTTRFIEDGVVPKDAKVVGKTWLKVNKNGTPDKRFKDNRQVPICEYGAIIIESGAILYVELMCSNSNTIEQMRTYTEQVFK